MITSRISIISIIIFFLAGAGILAKVDHAQGIKAAISEDEEERARGGYEDQNPTKLSA